MKWIKSLLSRIFPKKIEPLQETVRKVEPITEDYLLMNELFKNFESRKDYFPDEESRKHAEQYRRHFVSYWHVRNFQLCDETRKRIKDYLNIK